MLVGCIDLLNYWHMLGVRFTVRVSIIDMFPRNRKVNKKY